MNPLIEQSTSHQEHGDNINKDQIGRAIDKVKDFLPNMDELASKAESKNRQNGGDGSYGLQINAGEAFSDTPVSSMNGSKKSQTGSKSGGFTLTRIKDDGSDGFKLKAGKAYSDLPLPNTNPLTPVKKAQIAKHNPLTPDPIEDTSEFMSNVGTALNKLNERLPKRDEFTPTKGDDSSNSPRSTAHGSNGASNVANAVSDYSIPNLDGPATKTSDGDKNGSNVVNSKVMNNLGDAIEEVNESLPRMDEFTAKKRTTDATRDNNRDGETSNVVYGVTDFSVPDVDGPTDSYKEASKINKNMDTDFVGQAISDLNKNLPKMDEFTAKKNEHDRAHDDAKSGGLRSKIGDAVSDMKHALSSKKEEVTPDDMSGDGYLPSGNGGFKSNIGLSSATPNKDHLQQHTDSSETSKGLRSKIGDAISNVKESLTSEKEELTPDIQSSDGHLPSGEGGFKSNMGLASATPNKDQMSTNIDRSDKSGSLRSKIGDAVSKLSSEKEELTPDIKSSDGYLPSGKGGFKSNIGLSSASPNKDQMFNHADNNNDKSEGLVARAKRFFEPKEEEISAEDDKLMTSTEQTMIYGAPLNVSEEEIQDDLTHDESLMSKAKGALGVGKSDRAQ